MRRRGGDDFGTGSFGTGSFGTSSFGSDEFQSPVSRAPPATVACSHSLRHFEVQHSLPARGSRQQSITLTHRPYCNAMGLVQPLSSIAAHLLPRSLLFGALQLVTPRRVNGAEAGFGFDHALTHGKNPFNESASFGVESYGNAPSRHGSFVPQPAVAAQQSKKFAPTSLLDAMKRGGGLGSHLGDSLSTSSIAAPTSIPRSPAQGAVRTLRSSNNKESTMQMPTQSLRDSPFMRAPAAHSTPAAPSTASARLSTPFSSEESPIRPALSAAATPAVGRYESKEAATRLFPHTPAAFASPSDSAWLATPAHAQAVVPVAAQGVLQQGLGFGARNPCAVTVFGFAPHQAARVLARFHGFGACEVSREDGSNETVSHAAATNWVHLLYETPVAASMALAQNGRVIDGAMIGVKPRTEPPSDGGARIASVHTPAAERASIFDRSSRKTAQTPALTAASIYAVPASTNPASVHKSACTKLMEYLFNW